MPEKPEFSIPVSQLDASGNDYDLAVRASWMRGALEDHEATAEGPDGHLHVRLSKSGTDVVVRGRLEARLTAPCARCLGPASFVVNKPISALMVPASALRVPEGTDGEEAELPDVLADTMPYDGETVVLDDLVHDELVLETPMIPLCSEDCPGMSAPRDPDEEAPIDPRLSPLLRLRDRAKKA